ncbi:hypothetical protein F5878DRAFT_327664 [Lentinula raphanica]|uniref:Uncharacterized protein n=1 Tax=Lentinula raphanica TaxID=153919 RepID=A0AA38P2I4_9AGAR|nr:hypothetical protein F5878DRAFT_327664 [Lentinula raphanica]
MPSLENKYSYFASPGNPRAGLTKKLAGRRLQTTTLHLLMPFYALLRPTQKQFPLPHLKNTMLYARPIVFAAILAATAARFSVMAVPVHSPSFASTATVATPQVRSVPRPSVTFGSVDMILRPRGMGFSKISSWTDSLKTGLSKASTNLSPQSDTTNASLGKGSNGLSLPVGSQSVRLVDTHSTISFRIISSFRMISPDNCLLRQRKGATWHTIHTRSISTSVASRGKTPL